MKNKILKLIERLEDEEDSRDIRRILAEIRAGKQRFYTKAEFEEKTGLKV